MDQNTTASYVSVFLPLILFFFVLWFFLIRPQRKKDKETKEMRDSLVEGDSIVTIGGIMGTVMKVKEESVVVYVGSDKTKMEFKKWAIAQVVVKNEKAAKEAAARKAAEKAAEKEAGGGSRIRRLKKKDPAEEAAEETAETLVDGESVDTTSAE